MRHFPRPGAEEAAQARAGRSESGPSVRWALVDRPAASCDGVTLSDGRATLVVRGRVVFLRVFVGDEAAAAPRLRARPERACCCPLCWPRDLRRQRGDKDGAVRQYAITSNNVARPLCVAYARRWPCERWSRTPWPWRSWSRRPSSCGRCSRQ